MRNFTAQLCRVHRHRRRGRQPDQPADARLAERHASRQRPCARVARSTPGSCAPPQPRSELLPQPAPSPPALPVPQSRPAAVPSTSPAGPSEREEHHEDLPHPHIDRGHRRGELRRGPDRGQRPRRHRCRRPPDRPGRSRPRAGRRGDPCRTARRPVARDRSQAEPHGPHPQLPLHRHRDQPPDRLARARRPRGGQRRGDRHPGALHGSHGCGQHPPRRHRDPRCPQRHRRHHRQGRRRRRHARDAGRPHPDRLSDGRRHHQERQHRSTHRDGGR